MTERRCDDPELSPSLLELPLSVARKSVQVRDQLLDECNGVRCVFKDYPIDVPFNIPNVEQGPEGGNDFDDSYRCSDIPQRNHFLRARFKLLPDSLEIGRNEDCATTFLDVPERPGLQRQEIECVHNPDVLQREPPRRRILKPLVKRHLESDLSGEFLKGALDTFVEIYGNRFHKPGIEMGVIRRQVTNRPAPQKSRQFTANIKRRTALVGASVVVALPKSAMIFSARAI